MTEKRAEGAARTNSTHDGDSKPIKMHSTQGFEVTEAIPELRESVVGDEHCLNKFDNVDAIDEIFCEFSVVRKC